MREHRSVRAAMKLLLVAFLSWAAGIGAYIGAIGVIWGQRVSGGDLRAVLLVSALASGVTAIVAYAPAMFALRARLSRQTWGPYVLLGIGLGVLPVLFIISIYSSDVVRSLLTPEAGLFYCMFAIFGAVFGSGFFLAYVRRSS